MVGVVVVVVVGVVGEDDCCYLTVLISVVDELLVDLAVVAIGIELDNRPILVVEQS